MIRRPPRSTPLYSSAASDVYKRQRRESSLARGRDVASVANQVEDQPALQIGARVGYAVSGVLHLLIGWIALQVAWFASAKSADQSGALQTISGKSTGTVHPL